MKNVIHIFGASGSGTTTLGKKIFAISTYNTDYVLIKKENYQKALDILGRSGYEIAE